MTFKEALAAVETHLVLTTGAVFKRISDAISRRVADVSRRCPPGARSGPRVATQRLHADGSSRRSWRHRYRYSGRLSQVARRHCQLQYWSTCCFAIRGQRPLLVGHSHDFGKEHLDHFVFEQTIAILPEYGTSRSDVDFREVLNDPTHEKHDNFRKWCGGSFDPPPSLSCSQISGSTRSSFDRQDC